MVLAIVAVVGKCLKSLNPGLPTTIIEIVYLLLQRSLAFIRRIIYKFLNVCPIEYMALEVYGKVVLL